MRNNNAKHGRETVGIRQRPMESFNDVKFALTEYLRRTNPGFLIRSDMSAERGRARFANRHSGGMEVES